MSPNLTLTAETLINAPIEKIWEYWTNPQHIIHWNNASEEWHTPHAENELRIGGKLTLKMELKNGTDGFDYICIYDDIIPNERISHTTSDNRKTTILFTQTDKGVKLTETFEPVTTVPLDDQQAFCQSILNKFKAYAEHA